MRRPEPAHRHLRDPVQLNHRSSGDHFKGGEPLSIGKAVAGLVLALILFLPPAVALANYTNGGGYHVSWSGDNHISVSGPGGYHWSGTGERQGNHLSPPPGVGGSSGGDNWVGSRACTSCGGGGSQPAHNGPFFGIGGPNSKLTQYSRPAGMDNLTINGLTTGAVATEFAQPSDPNGGTISAVCACGTFNNNSDLFSALQSNGAPTFDYNGQTYYAVTALLPGNPLGASWQSDPGTLNSAGTAPTGTVNLSIPGWVGGGGGGGRNVTSVTTTSPPPADPSGSLVFTSPATSDPTASPVLLFERGQDLGAQVRLVVPSGVTITSVTGMLTIPGRKISVDQQGNPTDGMVSHSLPLTWNASGGDLYLASGNCAGAVMECWLWSQGQARGYRVDLPGGPGQSNGYNRNTPPDNYGASANYTVNFTFQQTTTGVMANGTVQTSTRTVPAVYSGTAVGHFAVGGDTYWIQPIPVPSGG